MKPILFSTDMVKAILDDRKSMTRRVIKPQPTEPKQNLTDGVWVDWYEGNRYLMTQPRYQIGDVLYVRETWRIQNTKYDERVPWKYTEHKLQYRADFTDEENAQYGRRGGLKPCKWKPSIHMPKEAARIFLRVTEVRAERLQEIGRDDCEKEGLHDDSEYIWRGIASCHDYTISRTTKISDVYRQGFATLWDSINAKRNGGIYAWDKNPFCWVYSFEKIERGEL